MTTNTQDLESRVTNFKVNLKEMVAVNDTAYKNSNTKSTNAFQIQYTKDQALNIITNGKIEDLQSLSQYFWYSSGLYRNFILYLSTMLSYDTLLVPKLKVNPKKGNFTDALGEKYFQALSFVDTVNVPLEFARIMTLMLINGAYYGVFREFSEDTFVIQDLPYAYCRTRFKNAYKNNVLEFDCAYFDRAIRDELERKKALDQFPPEFKKAYNAYTNDSNKRWFQVSDEVGIVFYHIDTKPMLISAIPAIIELDSYRDLEYTSDKQNLHKILAQKIPLNKDTNEPILEMPEIKEIHKGMVGMLKNTPNIDVLTTFNDIDLLALQDVRQVMKDNLEKMERSVYIDAGISKQIFNADGNLSLSASIKNDESLVFDIVKQFDVWINYQLNTRFAEKEYR